tara:strand:+ start:565 stop:1236 length:672 start_codon:yes stop_codon:yes gene_type:complete
MAIVTARHKFKGKNYELKVDLEEALKVKKDEGDITLAVESPAIYHDVAKGTTVSDSDLTDAFNSTNLHDAAKIIIQKGEVQKTQEFRDSEQEEKRKQIITLILKNASDQHGNPYTEERITRAMDEAHINIDKRPAEQQLPEVISKLKEIIPIKIETKKIKITIPAQYTGQAYSIVGDYKESESWLDNGSLEVTLNIPSGMQMEFYEKLNDITHGAVQSEEISE